MKAVELKLVCSDEDAETLLNEIEGTVAQRGNACINLESREPTDTELRLARLIIGRD